MTPAACNCRTCGIVAMLLRGTLVGRGIALEVADRVVVYGEDFRGTISPALAYVGVRRNDGTVREVRRLYDLDESLELAAEPGIHELEYALEMEAGPC